MMNLKVGGMLTTLTLEYYDGNISGRYYVPPNGVVKVETFQRREGSTATRDQHT